MCICGHVRHHLCVCVLRARMFQEVWMEYMDIERVQHELNEVLNLWQKVKSEPSFLHPTSNSIFTDFINPHAGTSSRTPPVACTYTTTLQCV